MMATDHGWRGLLTLLLVAIPACASTSRLKEPTAVPTVQARLTQAYREMAAGDLDRLMDLYLRDALIQSPGEPAVAGSAAIRAYWQTLFDHYHVELVPEVQEIASFGQIAVIRGRAVGVLRPKSGAAALPIDSWFMQIYRRQADGTWRFWRGANGPNAAGLRTRPNADEVVRAPTAIVADIPPTIRLHGE